MSERRLICSPYASRLWQFLKDIIWECSVSALCILCVKEMEVPLLLTALVSELLWKRTRSLCIQLLALHVLAATGTSFFSDF